MRLSYIKQRLRWLLEVGDVMGSNRTRRMVLAGCFTVSVFAAATLGYVAGSASPAADRVPEATVAASSASTIVAVSGPGKTSTLTNEQAEIYEKYSTSIDPSELTFEENVGLSSAEVKERKESLATDYTVGEPLSLEDLEFMRAYLIDKKLAPDASTPVINTAAFNNSELSINLVGLFDLNASFNVTKSGAGATANAKGSTHGTINAFDGYWSTSWTTKRTAGVALTKIKSSVTASAFGAVAAWPFVGLIYSQSYSATSGTGASSWYFSRNGYVPGLIAYMQIDCKSFVYTKSGSFVLP